MGILKDNKKNDGVRCTRLEQHDREGTLPYVLKYNFLYDDLPSFSLIKELKWVMRN